MRAALGGLDDLAGGGKSGGQNDQRLRAVLQDPAEQLHAVEGFQLHRRDHHAHRGFFDHLDGVRGIVAAQNPQILGGKMLGRPIQEIQIGIDEQQGVF